METMGGIPKNRGAAVGSVAKVPPRPPSIAALVYTQAQQRKGNFTALEIYLVQDCSDLLPRRRCHKGLQATTCHHSKLVVDGTNERVDGQSRLLPVLHSILVGLHLWLSKELVKDVPPVPLLLFRVTGSCVQYSVGCRCLDLGRNGQTATSVPREVRRSRHFFANESPTENGNPQTRM